MKAWKIERPGPKGVQHADGGSRWAKLGKTWHRIGDVMNHLRCNLPKIIRDAAAPRGYRNPTIDELLALLNDDAVLVEYELVEKSRRPVRDVYREWIEKQDG